MSDQIPQQSAPLVDEMVSHVSVPHYTVQAFSSSPDAVLSVGTDEGWNIEGDFLCVYNNGLKQAHRLPNTVMYLDTVPGKPERKPEPDPLTDPIETFEVDDRPGWGQIKVSEATEAHDTQAAANE